MVNTESDSVSVLIVEDEWIVARGLQKTLEVEGYEVADVVNAAPYVPAISHIDGDTFFIGWSQGSSPEFVAHGMFVAAP